MKISNMGVSIEGAQDGSCIGSQVRFKDNDFVDVWIDITSLVRLIDMVRHSHKNDFDSFVERLFENERMTNYDIRV